MKHLILKSKGAKAFAIGIFDGLHAGHMKIINRLCKEPVKGIITFYPHPRKGIKYIQSFSQRLRTFKKLGIDEVIVLQSRDNILDLSASEFLEAVIKKLNINKIIVGSDFKLGHGRDTDVLQFRDLCKAENIDLIGIPVETKNGEKLSSTIIRDSISAGNIDKFEISGIVRKGSKIAKELGFPTANIIPGKDQILPQNGVYKTQVIIDGINYNAATYIGTNPTLKKQKHTVIETHIPGFNKNIYGKRIRIIFKKMLRNEIRFSNKEDLINAITEDLYKIFTII